MFDWMRRKRPHKIAYPTYYVWTVAHVNCRCPLMEVEKDAGH
jgi:hypothetical protein